MKQTLTLISACAFAGLSIAQEEKPTGSNLVPNSDFEGCANKLLKAPGMLEEACKDWFSASQELADLFAVEGKTGKAGVPDNLFGRQSPESGSAYSGFRAYSKDPKYARSYISVKLTEELVKDQTYCIRYQVSLADLSKYAVNGLGAFVAEKKTVQPNKGDLIRTAQMVDKSKVFNDMDGWQTVCGSFTASGKEEYLILGCFEEEKDLKLEKTKKPTAIPGTPIMQAYYFVDDVQLTLVDSPSKCMCKPGGVSGNREPELIYGKSSTLPENASPSEIIRASTLYYAAGKSNLAGVAERDLDQVAKLLLANKNLSVTVFGHCDDTEFERSKTEPELNTLAQDRADAVVDYLVKKGCDPMRVLPRSRNNTEPASTMKTPLSQAQNRRVTFLVK